MAPNDRARKIHDELFPGHVSTLAVTDPEFIEVFDNFAFDETLRHSKLDSRTRLMVQLAATIAVPALRSADSRFFPRRAAGWVIN
jgi:4-carboxymuconolactone decarboxylase